MIIFFIKCLDQMSRSWSCGFFFYKMSDQMSLSWSFFHQISDQLYSWWEQLCETDVTKLGLSHVKYEIDKDELYIHFSNRPHIIICNKLLLILFTWSSAVFSQLMSIGSIPLSLSFLSMRHDNEAREGKLYFYTLR